MPLKHGDTAIVETRFVNTKGAKILMEYVIYRAHIEITLLYLVQAKRVKKLKVFIRCMVVVAIFLCVLKTCKLKKAQPQPNINPISRD